MEQEGDRKINALLQTVEELIKLAPEIQFTKTSSNAEQTSSTSSSSTNINLQVPINNQTSTQKTKSRRSKSPSPSLVNKKPPQVSGIVSRLADAYDELKKYQKLNEDERSRRSYMRRAASTETDEGESGGTHRRGRGRMHNGSLYRKSLSLDQSIHQDQVKTN